MRDFQIKPYLYLAGALLLFSTILMSWLWFGRLSLFQTSSYISLYGLSREHLYQGHVFLLTPDSKVKQSFVSEYPGLYKVSVLLTSQEKLSRDVDVGLVFHLRETCDTLDDLRQVRTSLSASNFGGDMFYTFTFEPIDDSLEREYCFILTANLEQNNEATLGARASSVDVYSEGKAFYDAPSGENETITTVEPTANQPKYEHKVFLPLIQSERLGIGELDTDVGFQLHYNGRAT